ncbi:MAG: hypothetical protein H6502_02030 [Candidatus Woesearchaeota archaeon]|nr:MAG: hypothetical protein H6502_02030 [Candidatus Woesearchaeota archaeon]
MNRKADLSINFLVLAAIGLLIMVVIIALVINQRNKYQEGTSCFERGGVCKPLSGGLCSNGASPIQPEAGETYCKSQGEGCCPIADIQI